MTKSIKSILRHKDGKIHFESRNFDLRGHEYSSLPVYQRGTVIDVVLVSRQAGRDPVNNAASASHGEKLTRLILVFYT